MFKYLFGSEYDDQSSKLVNQPTLDFNSDKTQHLKKPHCNNQFQYGTVIDYSDDDEIDYDVLQNTQLINEWNQEAKEDPTRWELPQNINLDFSKDINQPTKPLSTNSNLIDQLKTINLQIKSKNQTLMKMSDFIDLYNENEPNNVPNDIIEKYQTLQKCYLNELNRVEKLYQAYHLLFQKYIQSKQSKKRESQVDDTNAVIKLKDKLRLIKSKTNDQAIKNICGNVMGEIDKMTSSYNEEIDGYKKEVEKLKEKVKSLETKTI